MNYEETTQYLFNSLPMFHRVGAAAYKASLDTTIKLDEYFNHPHTQFSTIHVAGTNGKGSVSHILASVLQSAGYKVGLYTSPHLKDFRERVKINGAEISENDVVEFVEKHKQIFAELHPSFFEMTVALAFDYFAKKNVDIAVIEVGLGGRLDSTNIISPLLSVITNIGLDHTEFLGKTIAKIASEKAGIIKAETPVVIGEWNDESAKVFNDTATQKNAEIYFADKCFEIVKTSKGKATQTFEINPINNFYGNSQEITIDLLGDYQSKNVITALAAINVFRKRTNFLISDNDIQNGFSVAARQTGLRGRWQIINEKPLTILDTGHNPHGLHLSMQQLKTIDREKLFFVFGVVKDKDLNAILDYLPKDAYYIFTAANIPRSLPVRDLQMICTKAGLRGEPVENVKTAFEKAKKMAKTDDVIFVGGSTYVVAELF